MALLDDVKVALRVKSGATDSEIGMWIDAALADMRRVGIDESMLDAENPSALVKAAVVCFAKASYGYDVEERPQFQESYRSIVCDLMNSSANIAAKEPSDG